MSVRKSDSITTLGPEEGINRRQFLQLGGAATVRSLFGTKKLDTMINEATPFLEVIRAQETCTEFVSHLDVGSLHESVPNEQAAQRFEIQAMLYPPLLDQALLQHISDNLPFRLQVKEYSDPFAVGLVGQQLINEYFQSNPAIFSSMFPHWDFTYEKLLKRYRHPNGTPVDTERDLVQSFEQMDDLRITSLLKGLGHPYSVGSFHSSPLEGYTEDTLGASYSTGEVEIDLEAHEQYPFWMLYTTIVHEFGHNIDISHVGSLLEHLPKNEKTAQLFNLHARAASPANLLKKTSSRNQLFYANGGIVKHQEGVIDLDTLATHVGEYPLHTALRNIYNSESPHYGFMQGLTQEIGHVPILESSDLLSGDYKQLELYQAVPGWQRELLDKVFTHDPTILDRAEHMQHIELKRFFEENPKLCVLLLTGTNFDNPIPDDVLIHAHSIIHESVMMEYFAEIYSVLMYFTQLGDRESIRVLKKHEPHIVKYYTAVVGYLQDVNHLYTDIFVRVRQQVDSYFKSGPVSELGESPVASELRQNYDAYSAKLDELLSQ